jgi:hypothetical protein
MALGFLAGLSLLAGCNSASSSSTTTIAADFVMVEGEGPGELANQIARQGLQREDGTLRTLVSAEHIGRMELPGRTIQVVAYETGRERDTSPCLAIVTDDGERGSTFRSCGTSLPENIGVLGFEAGGATEVLVVRVSIETATVVVANA